MRHTLTVGLVASLVCCAFLASSTGHAEADPKIARTWKAKCSSCHGVDGKAGTDTGAKLKIPDMTTAAWQKGITDVQMKKSIAEGVKPRNGNTEGMDGFAEKGLTPEQIDGLVAVVRGLGK